MSNILEVKKLKISFCTGRGWYNAVKDVSFTLKKGETLGILGDSGSGKTVCCKAVMGLMAPNAVIDNGSIMYSGMDLTKIGPKDFDNIRGSRIAMVFQDPISVLNPIVKIGRQLIETMVLRGGYKKDEARRRGIELLTKMGIREPEKCYEQYPFELSGGMRQRVVIAIALSLNPEILICDEPTSSLDVNTQKQILDLINRIKLQRKISVIFISHDLNVLNRVSERIVIMKDGRIAEDAKLEVTETLNKIKESYEIIKPLQCLYTSATQNKVILEVKNLKKYFKGNKGTKAVDDVSFQVYRGEVLGIVGESGCGKTTLARTIMKIYNATAGKILYNGMCISEGTVKDINRIQMIFQDPLSSLNPRMTVREIVAEGLVIKRIRDNSYIAECVDEVLGLVGLSAEYGERYPHELSGGQCQRVAIARCIILKPDIIIADEPVSSLDKSMQVQIVNLLLKLREKLNLTILFISHDISLVEQISDRVIVMEAGKIVGDFQSVTELF